jgi:Putative Actinobacterial Holin-X, holin superfamily III
MMRVDSIMTNLRALLRAHSIIADIHARHFVTRSGIAVFAAMVAVFGFVMTGLAAFFALESLWGRIWAAIVVAAASFAIALILFVVARRVKHGRDLELAREVQRTALEGLLADGRAIEMEITRLRTAVTHPFEQLIPGVIVPLAAILMKAFVKRDRPDNKE